MTKTLMPIPSEWDAQDVVLYHLRKIGEYITRLSKRPYLWDRMSQAEKYQWAGALHNEVTQLLEVQSKLLTALYFTTAAMEEGNTLRTAEDKVKDILEAIDEVSQDYLTVDLNPSSEKVYNPLLRGQSICLNCQHWQPNPHSVKEGVCRANGTRASSTGACEQFEQFGQFQPCSRQS